MRENRKKRKTLLRREFNKRTGIKKAQDNNWHCIYIFEVQTWLDSKKFHKQEVQEKKLYFRYTCIPVNRQFKKTKEKLILADAFRLTLKDFILQQVFVNKRLLFINKNTCCKMKSLNFAGVNKSIFLLTKNEHFLHSGFTHFRNKFMKNKSWKK